MKYQFPNGFLWGAAASGVQTEGITNKANLNVWDQWCYDEIDRFYNQHTCHLACDTYTRFKEDVALMKKIGLNSFRTSIQWSRLIADLETNRVDVDGMNFYNNYIDELIKNGIKPIINLYHFDMPQQLMEDYGGFESRHVVDLFVGYATKCFELFGDRVQMFTVFNEPLVPIEFGYFYDAHRPNKLDPKLAIQVGYNTMLAQALVICKYKELNLGGEIGTILNLTPAYPRSDNKHDVRASEMFDLIFSKSFMQPSVYGTFPSKLINELNKYKLLPNYTEEELEVIKAGTVDFIGLNYYCPRRVSAPRYRFSSYHPWMPEMYYDNYQMPGSRINPHRDNNEIFPKALYDIAIDVKENYKNIKWYLAEIGISITNEEDLRDENGVIDDSFRTEILKEHLIYLHRAIEEGSNCFGVHQWTLIDNWSWLNSHKRRYGFYYLDLETRERYMKKHALWFKQIADKNGF